MPQNSTPEFGIPVWIALVVVAIAIGINHGIIINSLIEEQEGEEQEKEDSAN